MQPLAPAPSPFSDYIIYADESGDHGLVTIDPSYPVFVLAFCIFKKADYASSVVDPMTNLKFRYFGHDMVILHSHEIRKSEGPFTILRNETVRNGFLPELSSLIAGAQFTLIAAIIDKKKLIARYPNPRNPYALAMTFCLERCFMFLEDKDDHRRKTHVICEARGRREDDALELEFRRICGGQSKVTGDMPFELVFASKACNSPGLQIADLVSYPIGRAVTTGTESSPAFQAVLPKFRANRGGRINGFGRKVFP